MYKLIPRCWTFTVHKEVSKLRLAGLTSVSPVLSTLVIQRSISVLAWVLRGFMGDVPQEPSD
jgi:hypothetical protein